MCVCGGFWGQSPPQTHSAPGAGLALAAREGPSVRCVETTRLSVGQMAAASGMTAKALRHYDRIGLFAPDDVDDDTGYRWYGADRLPQARLIARLRSVGVPLDDVAACLAEAGDPDVVDRVLADHRRRLESRLTRVRGDLHRLTHLADDLEDDVPAPTPDLPAAAPKETGPG